MLRVFGWATFALLAGCEDGDINIFTIEDDISLGAELDAEIEANPDEYGVILDEAAYPDAYAKLNAIRDEILATGEVEHADDFEWQTHIIDDDQILNAFAAPGGYIYVYTGLLKYILVEDHFTGVLGHEIAHAAKRHSTDQLTEAYGIATLISIVLGDGAAADIASLAASVATLPGSKADESEADEFSVVYLCETTYAADGAAGFFVQLEAESTTDGTTAVQNFFSTHPSPATRVEDIQSKAAELACSVELKPDTDWAAFLATLP